MRKTRQKAGLSFRIREEKREEGEGGEEKWEG